MDFLLEMEYLGVSFDLEGFNFLVIVLNIFVEIFEIFGNFNSLLFKFSLYWW